MTRLLADAGIVRNRAKIEATIANARAVLDAVPEGLDELLWSFAPARHERPATLADVRAVAPESVAMAKELKRRGLRFVGPTTGLRPDAGDRHGRRPHRDLLAGGLISRAAAAPPSRDRDRRAPRG